MAIHRRFVDAKIRRFFHMDVMKKHKKSDQKRSLEISGDYSK